MCNTIQNLAQDELLLYKEISVANPFKKLNYCVLLCSIVQNEGMYTFLIQGKVYLISLDKQNSTNFSIESQEQTALNRKFVFNAVMKSCYIHLPHEFWEKRRIDSSTFLTTFCIRCSFKRNRQQYLYVRNNVFLKSYYQRMHCNTSSTSCSFSALAKALTKKAQNIESRATVSKTELYSFIQEISYYYCLKFGECCRKGMESMRENTLPDENTDCDANTLPGTKTFLAHV